MTEMTMIVDRENAIDFTLCLEEITQLFVVPDLDPFADQARVTSGIEDIVNHLRTQRLRKPPKISTALVLPKDRLTPNLEQETRDAVARYADYQIEQARRSLVSSRFEGRNKLPWGLFVLVITYAMLFLLLVLLPDAIKGIAVILTPVVSVVTWVAIWNPVEVLLYDRWEERRDLQIYTCIKSMDVKIQTA